MINETRRKLFSLHFVNLFDNRRDHDLITICRNKNALVFEQKSRINNKKGMVINELSVITANYKRFSKITLLKRKVQCFERTGETIKHYGKQ